MSEKLLHYIWQYKLYNPHNLQTDTGEKIEVIDHGKLNSDAGPDFFNAKIKIGDTLWAGNIEIHSNSSDWKRHNHQNNKAYNSVILHIADNIDSPILRNDGEKIPQLQLSYPQEIKLQYEYLLKNAQWIPCADKLHLVDSFTKQSWLNSLIFERLEEKANAIFNLLQDNKNNWEEAFYITLARNFGFGINGDAFEQLARSLPLTFLGKHKNNLFQLEALLFGQSGLLSNDTSDDYQKALLKEYDFLKLKFNLTPIDSSQWKFLRLRPANFPPVRIAQFASLIHHSSKLFSRIIENPNIETLQQLFNCEPSDYWKTHFLFGSKSAAKSKKLSKSSAHIILINTVVPFLFCYGKKKQDEDIQSKAIELLEKIPAEKNSIIEHWKELGIEADSAYFSQALLQLKKNYCDNKKCLQCRFGHKVLKSY